MFKGEGAYSSILLSDSAHYVRFLKRGQELEGHRAWVNRRIAPLGLRVFLPMLYFRHPEVTVPPAALKCCSDSLGPFQEADNAELTLGRVQDVGDDAQKVSGFEGHDC